MHLRFLEIKEKFLMKNFRDYFTPLWAVLSIRSVPSQQVSGGIFACVQIIGHHSITFCCILLLWHSDRIPTIITMGSNLFCRSIHNFMHLRFPEYFNQISYSITVWIWDLLMLSGDFVHGRNDESTIFFDDSNLWFEDFREVAYDLETCQRPWSTWILTLWASQKPENWKWSIKKYRTFVITSVYENRQTTWTSLWAIISNENAATWKYECFSRMESNPLWIIPYVHTTYNFPLSQCLLFIRRTWPMQRLLTPLGTGPLNETPPLGCHRRRPKETVSRPTLNSSVVF